MPSTSNWINRTWEDDKFYAHQSIIDLTQSKQNMWMMHVNVYPQDHMPSPIYGFDVICSSTKITGCFHDFSPTIPDCPLTQEFAKYTSHYASSKPRTLPEWAQAIFSPAMIASGNIKEKTEATNLATLGRDTLNLYFINQSQPIDINTLPDTTLSIMRSKSKYCYNQLQNPHSANVIQNLLSLTDEEIKTFKKQQFPY